MRSTVWAIARAVLEQSFGLLSFIVLARLLAPSQFGLFTLAAATIEVVSLVASGGWCESVMKAREMGDKRASTLFWGCVGISVIVAGLFALLVHPIAAMLGQAEVAPVLMALVAAIPLVALTQVHMGRQLREFGHKALASRALVAGMLSTTAGISVALAGGGVWALVADRYVYLLTTVVFAFATFRWIPKLEFSPKEFFSTLKFSLNVTLSLLVSYLVFRVPYFLSGRFVGVEAVAHYRIISRPLEMVSQAAVTPMVTVALPTLSRLQDDPVGFSNAYRRLVGLTALFCCPAILGFGAVSPDGIPVVFGQEWAVAASACQVLSLMAAPFVAAAYVSPSMVAVGAARQMVYLSVVHLVTAVAFTLAGVPFGLMGVAAAQVIRLYLLLPVQLWLFKRAVGLPARDTLAPLAPAFTASLVMAGVLVLARPWFVAQVPDQVLRLVAEVLVGGLVYALWLVLFCRRHLRWQYEGAMAFLTMLRPAR